MKALLALLLTLVGAAGPGTAEAKTLVSFEQSGGIAGVSVTVTVTTTGRTTVHGRGDDRSDRLHAATLRRLRTMLAAARFDRADPGASHCADCFQYSVRYRGRHARYDDSQARQVPKSVRAVVSELQRISRGGR